MFASLWATPKSKLNYVNVIGEIVVKIPDLNEFGDVIEDSKGKSVVFVTPLVLLVHELKRRVAGELSVPLKNIHLFYKGTMLLDEMLVPDEVFENIDGLEYDSDEEYFRPRVCLQIYSPDDPNDDEANKPQTAAPAATGNNEEVAVDNGDAQSDALDEEELAQRSLLANQELLALDEKQEEEYNYCHKAFNLKEELNKINCGKYYEALARNGYQDLGAFSHISDEVLAGRDIWASRIARARILALSDAMRRKHKLVQNKNATNTSDSDSLNRFGLGDGDRYATKAAMKRAWAIKSREATPSIPGSLNPSREVLKDPDELGDWAVLELDDALSNLSGDRSMTSGAKKRVATGNRVGSNRPRKILSTAATELIADIERIGKRDEFDCLENAELMAQYPIVNRAPLRWCCEAHRLEAVFTMESTERTKLELAMSDVRNAVERADTLGNGVIPICSLRFIVLSLMKKRYINYPVELVEKLLDDCLANWEEIVRSREWGAAGDKVAHFDGIPHPGYSISRFMKLLAEKLIDETVIKKYLVHF